MLAVQRRYAVSWEIRWISFNTSIYAKKIGTSKQEWFTGFLCLMKCCMVTNEINQLASKCETSKNDAIRSILN